MLVECIQNSSIFFREKSRSPAHLRTKVCHSYFLKKRWWISSEGRSHRSTDPPRPSRWSILRAPSLSDSRPPPMIRCRNTSFPNEGFIVMHAHTRNGISFVYKCWQRGTFLQRIHTICLWNMIHTVWITVLCQNKHVKITCKLKFVITR